MMTRLILGLVFAGSSFAALNDHPRLLQSDRHGQTLLTYLRAKAQASHATWTSLLAQANYDYASPPAADAKDTSAKNIALVAAVLTGAPSSYGASYSAEDYAAKAIQYHEDWLAYSMAKECGNNSAAGVTSVTAPYCAFDATDESYWTDAGGNVWYTTKVHKRSGGGNGMNGFSHDWLSSVKKAKQADLAQQWDWYYDGSVSDRLYVYSVGNPAAQGETLRITAAWLFFNLMRNEGDTPAMVYDLVYAHLSAQQKTNWYTGMRAVMIGYMYGKNGTWYLQNTCLRKGSTGTQGGDYTADNNGNSQTVSRVGLYGLATHGENPTDSGDSNEEMAQWKACWDNDVVNYFTGDAGRGGWAIEGEEYAGAFGHQLDVVAMWFGATGEDLYQDISPFCADTLDAYLRLAPPEGALGIVGRPQGVYEWGERTRTYWLSSAVMNRPLRCAYIEGSTTRAREFRSYFSGAFPVAYDADQEHHKFVQFLWADIPESSAASTRPAFGGQVSALGAVLNTDKTSEHNLTVTLFSGIDTEQAHIGFNRNGSIQLKKAGHFFFDGPGHYAVSGASWAQASAAHSTLTVKREADTFWKGPRRGRHYSYGGCPTDCWPSVPRSLFGESYSYVRGNTGPGYYYPPDTTYGGWSIPYQANRDLVLFPSERLVLVDRVAASTAFQSRLQFSTPLYPEDLAASGDRFTLTAASTYKAVLDIVSGPAHTNVSGDQEAIQPATLYRTNGGGGVTPFARSTGLYPLHSGNLYVSVNSTIHATADSAATDHCWVSTIQTGLTSLDPVTPAALSAASGQFGVRMGSASPEIVLGSCGFADVTSLAAQSGSFTGTATIVGTGLAAGTYNITVAGVPACSSVVAGADGTVLCATTSTGEIVISQGAPALTITTECPVAPGTKDTAYSGATFAAVNEQDSLGWSVVSGALPAGLTLGESTGALSGTPTEVGEFSFTVQATDGIQDPATKSCAITINDTPPDLDIQLPPQINAMKDVESVTELAGYGGVAPYSFSILSNTCSFTPVIANDDELTFTATAAESCSVTVQVADDDSNTAVDTAQIVVSAPIALDVSARPVANGVIVTVGVHGLPADQACTVQIVDDAQQVITSSTDSGGLSRRRVFLEAPSPDQDQYIQAICGDYAKLGLEVSYRSTGAVGTGSITRTLPAPPAYLGAAKAILDYGTTSALGSSSAAVSCASGCALTVPSVPVGAVRYVRHRWLDAADSTVATGEVGLAVAR